MYILKSENLASRSKDLIPWHNRDDLLPVYPHLDDRIMIFVDAQTVTLFPYSSNQCSILQAVSDKKIDQCVTAHFWCKDDLNISESRVTFNDSIQKCKGLVQPIMKVQVEPFNSSQLKQTLREKWCNGNTTAKKRDNFGQTFIS